MDCRAIGDLVEQLAQFRWCIRKLDLAEKGAGSLNPNAIVILKGATIEDPGVCITGGLRASFAGLLRAHAQELETQIRDLVLRPVER
jgi:hypothetical protein